MMKLTKNVLVYKLSKLYFTMYKTIFLSKKLQFKLFIFISKAILIRILYYNRNELKGFNRIMFAY